MAKQKKRALTAAGISLETLEQTPVRATQFLFGLVAEPRARGILQTKGYDAPEHKRGFTLLEAVASSRTEGRLTDIEVTGAIADLDNWDEPNIRLLRASLRRFPAVFQHVLDGIEPIAGPGAVLNVETILKRLDSLDGVADAPAALAVLAKRGLDETERKRLAALVKVAKGRRSGAGHEGERRRVRAGAARAARVVRGVERDRAPHHQAPRLPHPPRPRGAPHGWR